MKTREIVIVLAIVALLALGGAGIYWYEEQQAASPAGQAADETEAPNACFHIKAGEQQ